MATGEKRDRSALAGSVPGRSSPWISRGPRPDRGNGSTSVPQIPCRARLGSSEGERPGTQGPGVGGLWVPVPALLCPQPSPLWPRRLAVSGAGAPGVICAPGRAGPFPPRAAAPLPPYRTPRWRGLSLPPPGLATPNRSFPWSPSSLEPLPEAIPSSPPPPPGASLLKRPPPPYPLHDQAKRLGLEKDFVFQISLFLKTDKPNYGLTHLVTF